MKKMQGKGKIESVGTVRNYEQALTRVAEWVKQNREAKHILHVTPNIAYKYLEERGKKVGQKTLDMERQAMQAMFKNVTKSLKKDETLTVIKCAEQNKQVLKSRAYTPKQVQIIANKQTEKNALSTELSYKSGIRAHELITLGRSSEQPPNQRPALAEKWQGRDGTIYTVTGKGGLVRNVLLPDDLAQRLEAQRLDGPVTYTDRGIHYTQRYGIGGGKNWSNSFSHVSKKSLGWSAGGHGLRHTYAQQRMQELQRLGHNRDKALEVVSQEMGHFRPEITETYLRWWVYWISDI